MNETLSVALDTHAELETVPGEPTFYDDTGYLITEQLADEVKALTDLGFSPVVIFAKNEGGLEPAELTNNILTELGYGVARTNPAGVVTNHTYRFDVIVCTVDFRVNDPDNHGITCWVGDDATTVISTQDIDTMQLKIQEGAKRGDFTGGVENALQFSIQQLQENKPDPTTPADQIPVIPKPTAIATVGHTAVAQATPTITVTPPDHRSQQLAEIAPKLAEAGGVTAIVLLLTATFLGARRLLKPRIETARDVGSLKKEAADLDLKLSETRDNNYVTLIGLIQDSLPENAEDLRSRKDSYLSEMTRVLQQLHQLEEEPVPAALLGADKLKTYQSEYLDIIGQLRHLQKEQDGLVAEIDHVNERLAMATEHIAAAHTRLQAMETWYQAYQSAHPFLPDPDVLMKYLRLKDQEISQLETKNAMLNADDLATIFTTKTAQFEHAVELLAAVQNDVDSVKSSFSSAKAFWSQTNLTEEQLFGEIAWLKEQTVVDLTDDLLFDDAEESAMLIRREAKNVQQFMDTFQQSSREIKASEERIQTIKDRGFNITPFVTTTLNESKAALQQALDLIGVHSKWDRVQQLLETATDQAKKAAASFLEWEQVHTNNEKGVAQLNADVTELEQREGTTYENDWQALQSYPESNYTDILSNFGTADQILKKLHDDPKDLNDLVSQVEYSNSLEVQEFGEAETKLAELRKQFVTAQTLFDSISKRLATVRQAEAQATAAINNAEKAIAAAEHSFAGADDRLVTEATEEPVKQAKQFVANAKQLITERSFIDASKQLQTAVTLATEALSSAEAQKQKLSQALKLCNQYRDEVESTLRATTRKVSGIPDVVVQQPTQTLLTRLTGLSNTLIHQYGELALLEDDLLFEKTQEIAGTYDQFVSVNQQLLQSSEHDLDAYHRAQSEARQKIENASQLISQARSRVSDSHARNYGSNYLSEAESILPSGLVAGASYDQLRQVSSDAERASSLAKAANQEAQEEIDRYNAEQRRIQEEERRKKEVAEKKRRDEQRAAEEKRKREERSSWSSSSSTSHSWSSSSSSSFSSSSRSFGSSHTGSGTIGW